MTVDDSLIEQLAEAFCEEMPIPTEEVTGEDDKVTIVALYAL